MTRFARAKGSKASNERKEEEATPWHVMQQQLKEQLSKSDLKNEEPNFNAVASNIKRFLNVKTEGEVWSEFSEFELKKPILTGIKSKSLSYSQQSEKPINCKNKNKRNIVDKSANSTHKSKSKRFLTNDELKVSDSLPKLQKEGRNPSTIINKKEKFNPKNKSIINTSKPLENESKQIQNYKEKCITQTKMNSFENTNIEESKNVTPVKSNNIHNNKNKFKIENVKEVTTVQNLLSFDDSSSTKRFKEQSNFKVVESSLMKTYDKTKNINKALLKISSVDKNIVAKPVADRKNVCENEFQALTNTKNRDKVKTIFANGREIEIVRFEAFWVRKDDADKLKNLRKRLRDQKIPNDKIKAIIKLERRKAEKALAREKTNVCYQCRKFGHSFSECPETNVAGMPKSGICFKCGSTEHAHFDCKVTHKQNFRYAVCFICNEQGHIARQCALNPQGQYPKGGSCHLCGEVTHLRKDCPKAVEEQTNNSVTIEKLRDDGLECISEITLTKKKQKALKNKVVQF